MSIVKCSVDGCNARLQPLAKPLKDKETWIYPECDRCLRPACEKHLTEIGDESVCDRCRREAEAERVPLQLIDLGIVPPAK